MIAFLCRFLNSEDHGADPIVALSFLASSAFFAFQGYALAHSAEWRPQEFGLGLAAILAPMVPGLFRKPAQTQGGGNAQS